MKKMLLAATVLALAGMNLQSARADVTLSIGFGVRPATVLAVSVPTVCVPTVQVIRPPAPCPRPAIACTPPPVVIVRPRPVCVTSERFVANRGDCRGYGRGNGRGKWCDGPRGEQHRFGRANHHYR